MEVDGFFRTFIDGGPRVSSMEIGVQRQYAPNSICCGCGPANSKGLRIDSKRSEGGLSLTFMPEAHHEAFPGMINGGVIGTLLDCHGNWTAAIADGRRGRR